MLYMNESSGWWALLSWVLFGLFWIIVIALEIWIVRKILSRNEGKSALDNARERYARGEISKEELWQTKRNLA